MSAQLEEKVVVVTGASRGIGAGVAARMLEIGLKVATCARGECAWAPPEDAASRWFHRSCDVTDEPAVEDFARQVETRLGPPDLWINNAGLLEPIGPARALDAAGFERLMAVNVTGALIGMKACLAVWARRGHRGTLVNISSGAASGAYRGWAAYCASKAALDHLTRVVALEEPEHRVHALAPGIIETSMQETIRRQSEEDFPDVERFRELKRGGALSTPDAPVPALLRLAFGPRVEDVVLDVRDGAALRDLGEFARYAR